MFTLKIETDNDAFQYDLLDEIKRILHEVSYDILPNDSGNIHDINGNKVGTWKLT